MSADFFRKVAIAIANIILTGLGYPHSGHKSEVKMDNILKVLLGVLGVAGLLALLTPSNVSVAPPVSESIVEEASAVDEVPEALPDEAMVEETDDEIVKFGEPMIDGNPVSDDDGPQQQNVDNPDQPAPTANGTQTVDYQQVLDNAAQSRFGVQTYQPAPAIAEPVNDGGVVE